MFNTAGIIVAYRAWLIWTITLEDICPVTDISVSAYMWSTGVGLKKTKNKKKTKFKEHKAEKDAWVSYNKILTEGYRFSALLLFRRVYQKSLEYSPSVIYFVRNVSNDATNEVIKEFVHRLIQWNCNFVPHLISVSAPRTSRIIQALVVHVYRGVKEIRIGFMLSAGFSLALLATTVLNLVEITYNILHYLSTCSGSRNHMARSLLVEKWDVKCKAWLCWTGVTVQPSVHRFMVWTKSIQVPASRLVIQFWSTWREATLSVSSLNLERQASHLTACKLSLLCLFFL